MERTNSLLVTVNQAPRLSTQGNSTPVNNPTETNIKASNKARETIEIDAPNSPASGAPGALSSITSWFAIGSIITHVKHGVKHKDAESIIKAITEIVKLPLAFIKGGGKMIGSVASLAGTNLPTIAAGAFGVTAGVVVGTVILPVLAVLGLVYLSIEAIKIVSHLVADAVFAHTYKIEDTLKILKALDLKDKAIAIKSVNKYAKNLSPELRHTIVNLLGTDVPDYAEIKALISYDAINKLVSSKVDDKDDAAYKKLYLSRRLGSSAGKAIGENLDVLSKINKEILLNKNNITKFNLTARKMLETTKVQQKKMQLIHIIGIALIAVAAVGLVLSLVTGTLPITMAVIGVAGGILTATQLVLRTCYLDNREDNVNFRLFIPKFFTKEEVHRPTRTRLWTNGKAKEKREYIVMNIFSLGIVALIDELKGSPFIKDLRKNPKFMVDADDYDSSLNLTPDEPVNLQRDEQPIPELVDPVEELEAVSMTPPVMIRKNLGTPDIPKSRKSPNKLTNELDFSLKNIAAPIAT